MALGNVHSFGSDDYVHAFCDPSDAVGDCVGVSGPLVSGLVQVAKVNPKDQNGIAAIGLILSKISPTVCLVVKRGRVRGVFSALTPGRRYFVGPTSQISQVPPNPNAGGIYHTQVIGYAEAVDLFFVEPGQRAIRKG